MHFHPASLIMKILVFLIFGSALFGGISCNCGCLKCSKHLRVVSPPGVPCKVIYRGPPCHKLQPVTYKVQSPVIPKPCAPTFTHFDYKIEALPLVAQARPVYTYGYEVQAPVIPHSVPSAPITGLVTNTDRIVLPAPICNLPSRKDPYLSGRPCNPIYSDALYPSPVQQVIVESEHRHGSGPIFETLSSDVYNLLCDCRYKPRTRAKRDLPILRTSLNFFLGLLPSFIRLPIQHTLRSLKHQQNLSNSKAKLLGRPPKFRSKLQPTTVQSQSKPFVPNFLQKLERVNQVRDRRSLSDGQEISLPFLRVTDVENEVNSDEDQEESSSEENGSKEEMVKKQQLLQPFNFDYLLNHNHIFYLLNSPIRLLHQFHKLGRQISPVFKSVPDVLINSKKYIRNFGKHLKNDVLNFASNVIGDFDELNTPLYRHLLPSRHKRSLNSTKKLQAYEPDYSLVFDKDELKRNKRYILKVVDEDEVEAFLREKLGGLVNEKPNESHREKPKKKNKEKEDSSKKKLVVEKLSSKLIIDNNGLPFIEIDGVKRPFFLNKKSSNEEKIEKKEENEEKAAIEENMKDKINSLIVKARERINNNGDSVLSQQHEVPLHIIKERINQILTEVQDLINLDFDRYSAVHTELCKLQSLKELLVTEWRKILMEGKANDLSSKVRLLDDFKELQIMKDDAVKEIASILSSGSNFMNKKLIRVLVRLQKLQCIIYNIIEDFGERIKMATEFDVKKEIKYVDYLDELHFVVGRTKHHLEDDLKKERDVALQNEMTVLERLRKMSESNRDDPSKIYEEAKVLWEIRNIDRLQKDTIIEMNEKISRGQRIRKELKILFDLLRQLENCEEKQEKILNGLIQSQRVKDVEPSEDTDSKKLKLERITKTRPIKKVEDLRRIKIGPAKETFLNRKFPHKTILEDKKPVRMVTNGYTLTVYKTDGFD